MGHVSTKRKIEKQYIFWCESCAREVTVKGKNFSVNVVCPFCGDPYSKWPPSYIKEKTWRILYDNYRLAR